MYVCIDTDTDTVIYMEIYINILKLHMYRRIFIDRYIAIDIYIYRDVQVYMDIDIIMYLEIYT